MMRRFLGGRCIMVLIGAGLGLAGACGAQAATIAVTTCNAADLITAINTANVSSGADTIELNTGCTYTLAAVDNTSGTTTNGLPVITDSLTINGHGDTIVRSSVAPAFRIFDFEPTAAASFQLNALTIRGGQSCCGSAGGGAIRNGSLSTLTLTNVTLLSNLADLGNGGAIYNDGGELTIVNSTVAQNDSGGGDGGGIYNNGGTLTVTGTTISSNRTADTVIVGDGGGLFTNGGTSTLTNCTVSGNSAKAGGGIFNDGETNLNNVTIVGNFTTGSAPDTGGGILNVPEHTVNVRNSIIALNSDPVGPDCWSDAGGIVSGGYNLIGDADACNWSTATGDQVGSGTTPINPLVGPLRNNGGPTMTQALVPGSPAIDAGNPSGCRGPNGNVLSTDQRGVPRPVAGDTDNDVICDIGAYELQLAAPTAAPALSPLGLVMLVVGLALLGVLALGNRPWRQSNVR